MTSYDQELLLHDIHAKVINYLNDKNIKPTKSKDDILNDINIEIGESSDFKKIKLLVDKYLENAVKTNSPQFYNQLFSGFSITSYIGEIISSLTNNSMYTFEMSPVATLIEIELIKKMSSLVGYKNGGGTFVPGGSNGNFLAMLAARHHLMPETMSSGLFSSSPLIAFVSNECHYSMFKSANQLGIGTKNVIKIDTDKNGRMIPEILEKEIQNSIDNGFNPFFVGATAGTTVRGCFDPIQDIAKVCKKYKVWFHIDASWGGSVLLSKKHKHLLKGSENADSLTWCQHKAMAQPLMCTLALFKNPDILADLNDVEGTEYLFHDDNKKTLDLGKYSLQCGRRVDALKLWLSWKYYGDSGYEKNINHLFEMAKYAEDKLHNSKILKQVSDVEFLNICFQVKPEELQDLDTCRFTIAVRDELLNKGKAMVNYAEIDGKTCIRLITANYELNVRHIDIFFQDIENTAKSLLPNFI